MHSEAPDTDSRPVAVFEVTEASGEKVSNIRKLDFLKRMLNIEQEGIFNNGGGHSLHCCRAFCSCRTAQGPLWQLHHCDAMRSGCARSIEVHSYHLLSLL